jgi:hypothetical protein
VIHPSQSSTNVRCLLVLDKQGYNTPTIADILEPAFLGAAYTTVAPYAWDYRLRFRILHDKVYTLTQAAFQNQFAEFIVPVNVTSQNIGAASTFLNHVYILIISSETNVLQLPVYYYTTRVRYTDD